MSKMSELDMAITELRNAASAINNVADMISEMFGTKPQDEKVVPTMTLPEIRGILAEKSRAGFTAEVRSLLLKYGADKLSAIDPSKYPSLATEAQVLGNG